MRLLIIGNGFDLAHELPTSYSNFLDFVKACEEYCVSGKCDDQYAEFYEQHKETALFDEIKEHINTNNRLLKYFLSIYEKRCTDGKRGWIDFESEISNIIQKVDITRKTLVEHQHERRISLPQEVQLIARKVLVNRIDLAYSINDFPEGFIDGRVDELLDGLNRLTRLLEIYLVEYVGSVSITKRLPIKPDHGFSHVLSFNYTDTFDKLYDAGQTEYCYIHGKARKDSSVEDCNLVLGIDEYLNQAKKDNENYFVWFKKFYQRIYKGTSSDYMDWIQSAEILYDPLKGTNQPENEVYIYGHSLDVTDKDIISRFIRMKNTKTYVYFYSREDLAKKIENLVKVIGEDELISRTGGKNRTLIFINAGEATIPV